VGGSPESRASSMAGWRIKPGGVAYFLYRRGPSGRGAIAGWWSSAARRQAPHLVTGMCCTVACGLHAGNRCRWPVDPIEAQWKLCPFGHVPGRRSPAQAPGQPPSAVTPSTEPNPKRLIPHISPDLKPGVIACLSDNLISRPSPASDTRAHLMRFSQRWTFPRACRSQPLNTLKRSLACSKRSQGVMWGNAAQNSALHSRLQEHLTWPKTMAARNHRMSAHFCMVAPISRPGFI